MRAIAWSPSHASNAPAVLLLAVGVAAGVCACASTASDATDPGSTTRVSVTLTNDGCPPDPSTIPAGAVVFEIANRGGDAVSEVELQQNDRILGEKENLAPGFSGSFSLRLDPGGYVVSCPGANSPQSTLTVVAAPTPAGTSGSGSAASGSNTGSAASGSAVSGGQTSGTGALEQATRDYATYVQDQVRQLVDSTQALAEAVESGDVAASRERYAAARVFYERIEPVAESFGDLDARIDGRANDAASPDQFIGFHRIEQALWEAGSTAGMTPVAEQLVSDVGQLQTLVATATYQPAQLANGAAELVDEIGSSKITGEEERYSHLDLLDFQANLDGARQAISLLEPVLLTTDADLVATLDARFDDVQAALDRYRSGDGFVSYTALTQDDTRTLAQKIDSLGESLSLVAPAVVGS